ncbi:MAG: Ig-like domain-containing protein [Actinomycetota bacterium]
MRRWRAFGSGLAAFAMIASLVVAATLAEGRPATESETNDGGAWVLNRETREIGHANRAVEEISGAIGPFAGRDFDVDQAPGVIVVHDRDAQVVSLASGATYSLSRGLSVPAGVEVIAAPGRVVVHDPATGTVWRFNPQQLVEVEVIDEQPALMSGSGRSRIAVGSTGAIARFDLDDDVLQLASVGGAVDSSTDLGVGADLRSLSLVGERAVLATDDELLVVDAEGVQRFALDRAVVQLAQPSPEAPFVAAVTADLQSVRIDLASGEAVPVQDLQGSDPVAPIDHEGCLYAVTTRPEVVVHNCSGTAVLEAAGPDVRLREVNGWVFVNDAATGDVWFVNEELEVTEISDWPVEQATDDQQEDASDDSGGDEDLIENPNADELAETIDALDTDDVNEQPQAADDEAVTRVDRPVVVDVLANDTDADNDPLVVEAITGVDALGYTPEGALVVVNADGSGVQVTPPPGFAGTITFGYRVHDGRQGRDEASVTVTFEAPDQDTNRPPETVDDNATVRAGESVSLNVLTNDSDPDGDVLVLTAVEPVDGGTVTFSGDGEVTFTPDDTSPEGTIELRYTVIDDFGEEATGVVRVRVRQPEANLPPQARNDVGQTAVGRPVLIDVLANDVDPDGDLLVTRNLVAVEPAGVQADLTPDGQFLFVPAAPGTYRFSYLVSDGPDTDAAQIRVEVTDFAENQPPVAVRDDLAVAIGESRIVRVLDNDGDPDGDIVGIVDWIPADGLEIEPVPGVGFRVTPTANAASRVQFRYWISDGTAEPVSAAVVVSVVPGEPVDRVPVATPDVIDARPGFTTTIPVLRNDYDPDGGPLSVAEPVAEIPEGVLRITPDGQALLLAIEEDVRFGFSFGYGIVDEGGNRTSATVEVRIVPPTQPNRAPIARPDVERTIAGAPIVIDPIINDADPDGDPITVEAIATQPANGTAVLQADGSVIYTPAEGFSGTDRFTYTLVDGYSPPPGVEVGALRSVGEILIGVMPEEPQNREPTAIDDTRFPEVEIGGSSVDLPVLVNDVDPDGDPLTITEVTGAAVGTVAIADGDRVVTYTPPADGESREVSFGYSIADGRGGADSAQVTLQLVSAPDPLPPIAVDDSVGPVRAGSTVTFDPRTNDLDPDGPVGGLRVVAPDDGSFSVLDDGSISLVAPEVTAQVAYQVVDVDGLVSPPAIITLLVVENQGPTVPARTVATPFETPVVIDLHKGVTDPDEDPLFYTLGTSLNGGSVRVVGSPGEDFLQVEFVPDPDFEGSAFFDFFVDDQNGHRVAATVTVEVAPPGNRPPTATDTAVTIEAGVPTPIDVSTLVDDPDLPRGTDELSFAVGTPAEGNVATSIDPLTGVVTVTSDVAGGNTTDSFDYSVTDIAGETATATVTITLAPASFAAPALVDDDARTNQSEAVVIPVLDNDVDQSPVELAGDGLIVSAVGVSPDGVAEIAPDEQSVTFTPTSAFFGTTSFTYTVQDGRRVSEFESTGTVTVEVIGFPDQPQPPSIDSVGDQYVVVTWQTPAGNGAPVDGYTLAYSDSLGGSGSVGFADARTDYRWEGLQNAVEYTFTVTARNAAGDSPTSNPSLPGIPDRRPEQPATPTVAFGDTQLTVTWTEPLNQGSAIVDYELEIGGGASFVQPMNGALTEWPWTGLTNGTDYQFRVRAKNDAVSDNEGWSDWSPWSASEHPLTVPDAPAQPTAARGDRQVLVTWNEPYDGGDAISLYQIQVDSSPAWVDVAPQGAVNTYTWTDLSNGSPVSFRVRAINRDPQSGLDTSTSISTWSDPVTPCTVPDAPAAPTVIPGDGQVTVSWVAPADQGCAITSYTVEHGLGGSQTVAGDQTSVIVTGLTNGTSYTFTVTANNEVSAEPGATPNPSPASAATVPFGLPFAPTAAFSFDNYLPSGVITDLTAGGTCITQNGSVVTGMDVAVNGVWTTASSNVGFPVDFCAGASEVADSGGLSLSPSTQYALQLRLRNAAGIGSASAVVNVWTWGPLPAPTVSANGGTLTASVSWTTPTMTCSFPNGCAANSFDVDVSSTGSRDGIDWSGTATSQNFNLSAGTYRVWVRANNDYDTGTWGVSGSFTVSDPPPSVTVSKGDLFPNSSGSCSPNECLYVNFDMTNFPANSTYGFACQYRSAATGNSWVTWNGGFGASVTTNGSGAASLDNQTFSPGSGSSFCVSAPGIGEDIRVVINGVASPAVAW